MRIPECLLRGLVAIGSVCDHRSTVFLNELKVKEARPSGHWELIEPLRYEGNAETFEVPAGFKTNFASVPRPFWWLNSRHGKHTKAAVLHDYLWSRANAGTFDRCDADGIFRRAMWELEESFARRWLMWAAVRRGKGLRELVRCGLPQFGLVILISALSLVFVIAGGLIVVGFLLLFWLVEQLAYCVLWAVRPLKQLKVKDLRPPSVFWWSVDPGEPTDAADTPEA